MATSPNYTDNAEMLKEIRDAEAYLAKCKRAEEVAKEDVEEKKAITTKALERLRALSRGEKGMFDDDEGDEEK